MFILDTVSCGGGLITNLDTMIPNITSTAINVIKVVIPVLLVIFGMLDLGKAVTAQKEDEIKKGQQTFFKRLLAAAIVFFVFMIVQLMLGIIAPKDVGENQSIINCINCFINGKIDATAKTCGG